jgi:hypothetical protein
MSRSSRLGSSRACMVHVCMVHVCTVWTGYGGDSRATRGTAELGQGEFRRLPPSVDSHIRVKRRALYPTPDAQRHLAAGKTLLVGQGHEQGVVPNAIDPLVELVGKTRGATALDDPGLLVALAIGACDPAHTGGLVRQGGEGEFGCTFPTARPGRRRSGAPAPADPLPPSGA